MPAMAAVSSIYHWGRKKIAVPYPATHGIDLIHAGNVSGYASATVLENTGQCVALARANGASAGSTIIPRRYTSSAEVSVRIPAIRESSGHYRAGVATAAAVRAALLAASSIDAAAAPASAAPAFGGKIFAEAGIRAILSIIAF